MQKQILIRDLTLRDGQQSLFATRMKQASVDRVLPVFKKAGFYAMEVWGGAVPDSVMRYLNENPWERLESIKEQIGDSSKLTALSRGRNLFGYNPYPEDAIEGFNRNSIKSGIDIMRIFDCLNDVDNMKSTIKYVKENNGLADCVVCYTIDPKFSKKEIRKARWHFQKLPKNIFTTKYFVEKAKELEKLGADIITIKDMAGLIPPSECGELIRAFKKELNIKIDYHTHCTPGYGLPSTLVAILNGVDIVDTAIMPFAGGPAAPAFEIIQIFCDKLGIDTGVNLEAVRELKDMLTEIRKGDISEFDAYKKFPTDIDITNYQLPKEIDQLFDKAIEYAKTDRFDELLETTIKIEAYFNFPAPNEQVRLAEIPGGMYTNMLAQLKQLQLDHLVDRVLELVPMVRIKAGCPPLVTPTSQIIGVQAVNCAIDENDNSPFYTNVSVQFVNLVKGLYGKTPIPINPKFRNKICGHFEEIPFDASQHVKQDNPIIPEAGGVKMAENEKEELLIELFPAVAKNYLKSKKVNDYKAIAEKDINEALARFQSEKDSYDSLSKAEKEAMLMKGLYSNW